MVPIGRDLAAFESTLISVLENRPSGCEILVAHDGTYDDPFELCDEVRFAVADSANLLDLVAAAAHQARGRFVHVLSDGLRASCDWTDEALEKFEHFDAGCVIPVIRASVSETIIAAGWCDQSDRLCKPAYAGKAEIGGGVAKFSGAYLQASFWRREVLRSLAAAFTGRSTLQASYAYEYLIRAAGWRSVLASQCDVLADSDTLAWTQASFARGKQLRAVRNHFLAEGWSQSLTASAAAVLANVLRPGLLGESLGQVTAPLAATVVAKQIRPQEVALCDDREMVINLSRRSPVNSRRAA